MSKITITMSSDWHVGSGTGRPGSVDRLVQRDERDLPYIPAKTLTGILRDSCELVATGLDNENKEGIWHRYLEHLFGSQPAIAKGVVEQTPIPAALSLRSAYLPETLITALTGKPGAISALTFIKPGVAIDPDSGTAKTDFLRFEEMVRRGSYLEAEYELNLAELAADQSQSLQALFVAGAAMAERLGAKRRRGAGKCKINILNLNLEKYLLFLGKEPPALDLTTTAPESKDLASTHSTGWYTIDLHLETISPMIVHARTLGNLVSTLDYIPGAALLPIISKQLRERVDLYQAIANNQIVISNATLEVDEEKGQSMPFALFQEKQNKQKISNRLGESINESETELKEKPQLKGMRAGYVANNKIATISMGLTTHNTVDDEFQRPTEDVGGVYSYEAIVAGTKFRAKIQIDGTVISKQVAEQHLIKLKNTKIKIGRSKKDDYGLVRINEVNFSSESQLNISTSENQLKVWLLSDALIRNSRLRPSTNPQDLALELTRKLGVPVSLKPDCLSVLARSRRTDSWQTRWGLPRPSLVGLSAGSCFLFEFTGEIDKAKLAEIQRSGIGERTVEGYGQLCFNHDLLETNSPILLEEKLATITKPQPKLIDNNQTETYQYAQIIEKAAWRAEIRRASANLAASPQHRQELLGITIDRNELIANSKPSMSQLGRLRSIVVTSLNPEPDRNSLVNNWIDELPPKIKDKWADGSLEKICTLLTTPDRVWTVFKNFDQLTLTQDGTKALKQSLWRETVQIVVLDCIRAHKRELEPPSEPLLLPGMG